MRSDPTEASDITRVRCLALAALVAAGGKPTAGQVARALAPIAGDLLAHAGEPPRRSARASSPGIEPVEAVFSRPDHAL